VLEPCNAKVLRTVLRGLGASNRAWLLGGCVASLEQNHLAGNGADFLLVLNSRTFEEPTHEAKQMTTGQPVGAASHTTGGISSAVRIGSKSVSSRSDLFCTRPRPRCSWGRFWVLERMNGKPSSPVLRGLGASNGAWLLDKLGHVGPTSPMRVLRTIPRPLGLRPFTDVEHERVNAFVDGFCW
jgi:hypothetical protein